MSDDRLARLMRGDEKGRREVSEQRLTCADCRREFAYSAEEQRFFREKGFDPPKRCKDCRQAKKEQRGEQR